MVAFNAVAPFLIMLGIGFAVVRLKLTDRPFMVMVYQLPIRPRLQDVLYVFSM